MSNRNSFAQVFLGFLILLAIHIVVLISLFVIGSLLNLVFGNLKLYSISNITNIIFLYSIFGIGLTQLLYVIPLSLRMKQQEKWGQMKGVIIGAVITALLNGGCWLIFNQNLPK